LSGYSEQAAGLNDRELLARFLPGTTDCSVLQRLQADLQSTQPFIQWEAEPVALRLKRTGFEADQPIYSVSEVKNDWSYTTFPIRLQNMLRII
jgi:hypothetical protein